MYHARNPTTTTTATATPVRRFISRRPALTAVTLAAIAGVAVTFKYISTTIQRNDLAQKQSARSAFYVPVERSGGGI